MIHGNPSLTSYSMREFLGFRTFFYNAFDLIPPFSCQDDPRAIKVLLRGLEI